MGLKSKLTVIKGEGRYPEPEPRRIYPSRLLIIKYYLYIVIGWIGIPLCFMVFVWFINTVDEDPIPEFFQSLPFLIFVGYALLLILPSVILIPVYVKTMEFIVHGDEIIVNKGIINRTAKYCPFRTITNISTTAGPFDRLLGIGCVDIETAGKSAASTGPEEKLEGLPLFREIRDYILDQLRIYEPGKNRKNNYMISLKKTETENQIINELKEVKSLLIKKGRK